MRHIAAYGLICMSLFIFSGCQSSAPGASSPAPANNSTSQTNSTAAKDTPQVRPVSVEPAKPNNPCTLLASQTLLESSIVKKIPQEQSNQDIYTNDPNLYVQSYYANDPTNAYVFDRFRFRQLVSDRYLPLFASEPYFTAGNFLSVILTQHRCGRTNLAHLLNISEAQLENTLTKSMFGFDYNLDNHTEVGAFSILNFKMSWNKAVPAMVIDALKKLSATCQEEIVAPRTENDCRVWMFKKIDLKGFIEFMEKLDAAALPDALVETGD